ncbi:MAG: CsbD family protein [Acidobacteria bacterium]|nr:CsbD family protein [Acidobacteriota bacterium]
MGAPNKDEMEGKYNQVKGSVKEGLGRLTGDDDMRAEGSADKIKGDVQEGWGGTKRKVGDMLEDAGDAIKH